jgi:hypothetical protein
MRSSIKTLAVAALTAGALVAAPAAFAADSTVSQAVTGGALSASVTGGTFDAIATAHSDQTSTASTPFSLTTDDLTGTAAGWHVTQQITSVGGFVYSGTNAGADISAANFSITPGTVTANGGASLAGVTAGTTGTLDSAVTVLSAAAGDGVGSYTLPIDATLTVPADSRAGTYTGTLTTSITAAP